MIRRGIVLVGVLLGAPALAGQVGVVCHVKVLSDKVEDVSSLEAWKASFLREGMTDREKALAVWLSVVKFQHQDSPPSEFLQLEDNVLDPLKLFNVYGYSFCSVATSHVAALARYAGLKARGWTIHAHCVPEVFWDGSWHLLDASLINYFPKADGELASVEEIVAAVKAWLAEHPDFKGSNDRLVAFHRDQGWTGWRRGPALLTRCPFYDPGGWLPARTHGWYSTMQEYDGSTLFPYETGYSLGYEVNIQLRPGERLTRNWSNKGLHVMMDTGDAPGVLNGVVGRDSLGYSPALGDLAPGRVGNGVHEYTVPLADGAFRLGALVAENLASKAEDQANPALHVQDPARPATLVLRMPSSYVYLTGEATLKAVVGQGGRIEVAFSDNHGLDWRPLATVTASGDQRLDLGPLVFRRYDYRLKLTLSGKGTGLDALRLVHEVQHSQRPLPALGQGLNTLTFSAEPPEGTITIEGSTEPKNKGKQLLYTDFHPERKNIKDDLLVLAAGEGEVTFPVETPGDLVRLRIGVYYRARDARDAWDVQVSCDGGNTFRSVGRCEGPTRNHGMYFVVSDVPPGTRAARVRFAGVQRNTTMIYQTRISADYREPHGGFRPVKITTVWQEGTVERRHVHVARTPRETYRIFCGSRPVMKGLVLELAE
jgi:hypothetical protein